MTDTSGVQPVQAPSIALRVAVRTAWLAGTDDFRRNYDEELFKVLGITSFQDLFPEGDASGVAPSDEPSSIRAFLHALQARNEKDNGLFPQVAHEVEADAKALRRVLAVLDFYHPPHGVAPLQKPQGEKP